MLEDLAELREKSGRQAAKIAGLTTFGQRLFNAGEASFRPDKHPLIIASVIRAKPADIYKGPEK